MDERLVVLRYTSIKLSFQYMEDDQSSFPLRPLMPQLCGTRFESLHVWMEVPLCCSKPADALDLLEESCCERETCSCFIVFVCCSINLAKWAGKGE